MFKIIGFIIGFALMTIAVYLSGFDFDGRNQKMSEWFVLSVVFGFMGSVFGNIHDKRN